MYSLCIVLIIDSFSSQNVISKCSNSCEPGEFKKTADGQHTCCYECIKCPDNHYSNSTGKFLVSCTFVEYGTKCAMRYTVRKT